MQLLCALLLSTISDLSIPNHSRKAVHLATTEYEFIYSSRLVVTISLDCNSPLWFSFPDMGFYTKLHYLLFRSLAMISSLDTIKVESDGDFHIRLRVDPQFASMINSANVDGQFGDLVLEPICQNRITQPDAIAACQNFHQNLNIPSVGTHVTVTGSYVHDLDHGAWSEIQTITSIKP